MSTIEKALQIAAAAHAGQTDKAGEPYILHPIRVMLAFNSTNGEGGAILSGRIRRERGQFYVAVDTSDDGRFPAVGLACASGST